MNRKNIFFFCILFIFTSQFPLIAQTWNTVGDSIFNDNNSTPGGTVYVIKKIDNLLFVGGGFHNIGHMKVNSIATWNGNKWDSLNSAIIGGVYDIYKNNNELYIGGAFGINGVPNGCIAKWNGGGWAALGSGLSSCSYVRAVREYNNDLYIGGSLFSNNITRWNGTDFTGLDGGVWGNFSHVQAMTEFNNELIVGGVFGYAGNKEIYNIAAWNGNGWHDLDTGTADVVNALVVDTLNNFLYVGGGFSQVGGVKGINASCIARWDGYSWDSLGHSNLLFCDGMTLTMYHNNLYMGMCSSGTTTNTFYLAKWNGKLWTPIYGPNNSIMALCVYNDELYVGGGFTKVGQDSIIGIAHYYEPPDTTCDYLQALIEPRNITLKTTDSTIVHFYNNIIHGSTWHWSFGDGATDSVRLPVHTYLSPGVYHISVIVTYQNCTDTAFTTVTIIDDTGIKDNNKNENYLGQNIPNPFNNTTTIPYYVPNGSKGNLQIVDTNGKMVKEFSLQQGKNKLDVSLKGLSAGAYYYSIFIDKEKKETKKMILQ